MKNLSYLKFLLLFTCVAITGCSKKENPIDIAVEELSIVLTSDLGTDELQAVAQGQMVTFTVMGSDGENYTSSAKLYLDDTEIAGPSYTFETSGSYQVKAVYEGTTSNFLTFEVLADSERALTIDVTRAMTNQTITFGLLDSSGEDMASEATFYVNDTAISGFTFSSDTEAAFQVYAKYDVEDLPYSTPAKSFSVYMPKRNVVIEDYTGTWCGFCLKATVAIDAVKALTDHVTVVAIHKKSGNIPEPLNFPDIVDLQTAFNVPNSFPQTQINRTVRWPSVPSYDYTAVTNLAGQESDVSIAIDSRLTGSSLSVDAKVVYRNGSATGDKLVVYLLENGVVADQANYFNSDPNHPYFDKGDPIIDYIHNDGLRNSLSGLFGDNIPSTAAFNEYKKTYNFNIPADYNANNLSFVVMVVNAENSAKNSQHSKLGENKTYN